MPRREGLKRRSRIRFVSLSSANVLVEVVQEPCTRASVELCSAKCSLSAFETNLSMNGFNVASAETHAEPASTLAVSAADG